MEYIKQSTGTTVTVGPFPSLGGTTSVTDLTKEEVSAAGGGGTCRLMQGGTSTEITVSNWEHYGDGYYALWLSGSSVATVGSGVISFTSTTPDFMPVWKDILVQSANVYDSLVGATDKLQVEVKQITAGVTPQVGAFAGVSINDVVAGVTINSFSSQAKGVLGGVTVAGVSAVYKVVPAGVTNIFDGQIEPGYSFKDSVRLQNAQQFGVSVGGGGTTCAFKDLSGTTYRIKATLDAGGNRTSIDALDPA